MADDKACACSDLPRLIFACSGASNLGRIADLAARTLTKDGVGKMYCLAGIGGRVSGIMENTKAASRIFAIDGCDQDCAKKCLELAGFNQVEQLRLPDLGMEKGKTPVTKKTVSLVADRLRQLAG